VVVSHDRWFLDRVATHILAYEGESKWFWFEGNFADYEKNKVERLGPEAARPHRATYRKLLGTEEGPRRPHRSRARAGPCSGAVPDVADGRSEHPAPAGRRGLGV
jgi:ATPase subunit of ABC transporter with duplicated ATPase domains